MLTCWRLEKLRMNRETPGMSDSVPPQGPRRYKWPWFVLAAAILFVTLAVIWMTFAVKREREQRDFFTPPPSAR